MSQSLTVFTPTYNRANMLDNLYQSLKNQIDKEFTWLIVDDGSTDNTREVINQMIKENSININYIYQKNSGKYIAHNTGVMLCETQLFVCVDSDDILMTNAVLRIKEMWETVKDDISICGIISPKKMKNNTLFKEVPNKGTLMELYNKYSFKGETMLVFRSSILKRFLFPCISNENFMQEDVIYNRIDRYYKYLYVNEYLYEAEYYDDGLSKNMWKISFDNPFSTLYAFKNTSVYQTNLVKKVKSYGCFLAFREMFKINSDFPELKVSPLTRWLGVLLKSHYTNILANIKKNL